MFGQCLIVTVTNVVANLLYEELMLKCSHYSMELSTKSLLVEVIIIFSSYIAHLPYMSRCALQFTIYKLLNNLQYPKIDLVKSFLK